MQSIINKTNITAATLFVGGLFAGWLLFSDGSETETHVHDAESIAEWTCSMHPQIRKTEPGACPLCGMDLIPVTQSTSALDPSAISMTEEAMKLASIQTVIVGNTAGNTSLRLFGKVKPDESMITTQAVHIPGRIEKLFVNTTGEVVKRGQLIATVYSPDLVTAQKELIEAKKMDAAYPQLLGAAKDKLRYWKIGEDQINRIVSSGEVQTEFNIYASTNGIVLKRNVAEGDYVQAGMMLFEIVNLSSVWIQFDGYESQLPFLKIGSAIEFTSDAVPGKTFSGKIGFIDPVMDPATRTSTVRVVYNNSDGRLKPDMFVTGVLQSKNVQQESITIPQTAVLWTGERSIVYVKNKEASPSFSLREVTLGEKQGDHYQIKSGLEAGEEIVMNGAFTVDAAAQLAGKPSMMGVEHKVEPNQNGTHPPLTNEAYQAILSGYLKLKDALVADDLQNAKKVAGMMASKVSAIDVLKREADLIQSAKKIEIARKSFQVISLALIELANNSEYPETLYVQFCPMADNNKGASWLSLSDEIRNPYFGASMLYCGEVTNEIGSKILINK